MSETTLSISGKNYSSWSLKRLADGQARADLISEEVVVAPDDADARAEILLLSPSIRVPCLAYKGDSGVGHPGDRRVPERNRAKAKGLLPKDQAVRAHCRSVCGEMHSGFVALGQALPMNIKAHFPSLQDLVEGARDIDRIVIIWSECLQAYGGPFLFGKIMHMADAMYAPVVSRFRTYGVKLDGELKTYAERIWDLPAMQEWREAALAEQERRSRSSRPSFSQSLPTPYSPALEFPGPCDRGKASHRLEVVEIHGVADVLARCFPKRLEIPEPGSCPC